MFGNYNVTLTGNHIFVIEIFQGDMRSTLWLDITWKFNRVEENWLTIDVNVRLVLETGWTLKGGRGTTGKVCYQHGNSSSFSLNTNHKSLNIYNIKVSLHIYVYFTIKWC